MTIRAFAPASPPGAAGVAVVSDSGNLLWHLAAVKGDHQYEWSLTRRSVDSDGLIYFRYNPGRYDGVAALRPSRTGMDVVAWPYEVTGSQILYDAQVEGPDQSGKHSIIQWTHSCNPSCATGGLTAQRLMWDGDSFSPDGAVPGFTMLANTSVGPVALPGNAQGVRAALVELFGREPDEDRSYSGCMAEVAGSAYAVTREIRWGDFTVFGDGPTSESLEIASWIVSGPDLPIPMAVYGGFRLGDDLYETADTVGGVYDELFHYVGTGSGLIYYGDDSDRVEAAGTLGGCD